LPPFDGDWKWYITLEAHGQEILCWMVTEIIFHYFMVT
jgi:hypothetical protein